MRPIIDGDIVAYYSMPEEGEPFSAAAEKCDRVIQELADVHFVDIDQMYIAIKSPLNDNYRFGISPEYKGNRKSGTPPEHLAAIRHYIIETWGAIPANGGEADDYIIIEAQRCIDEGIPFTIASIDKDLKQIPCNYYNMRTKQFSTMSKNEASLHFHSQLLTGDATDNIYGLTGIGPKRAAKLLEGLTPEQYPSAVAEAWKNAHPDDWREKLEVCWNLIRMARYLTELRRLDLPDAFQV